MSILALTSNTLTGSPGAGQLEYNGTIFAATPASTQRGIVPTEQFFALNAGLAGANATGAQSIFGVGVTLSASTQYEFEIAVTLSKTAGTTAHTIAFGFGGTATLNNIGYGIFGNMQNTASGVANNQPTNDSFNNTAAATVLTTSSASATIYYTISIKGTVSVNAGGTFIPQYTLSAAPGGAYTTQAGSYMKIKPIGASGANVSVGTWA